MLDRGLNRDQIEFNSQTGENEDGSVRVLDSFDLYVDPVDESLAGHLTRDGYWEAWVTSWMTRTVQPNWVCVDIGANFGYYTGVLSKLGSSVYAFEPNPDIFALLSKSLYANESWDNVALAEWALGAVAGEGVLTYNYHLQGSGSLLHGDDYFNVWGNDVAHHIVGVERLDAFGIPADFIKIDAEGFEPAIFEGGSETLRKAKVIVVEVTKDHPADFFDHLFKTYDVTSINYDGGEDPVTRDSVTCHDWMMLVLRRK